MTEELKDPFVNLPKAIYLSLPVVTILYILANVSYLAVLNPTELMASNAIAVVSLNDHSIEASENHLFPFFRLLRRNLWPNGQVL